MPQIVEVLNDVLNILQQAAMYLRNGQVLYSYRQMGYVRTAFRSPLDPDGSKTRTVNLVMTRLKKGEQIDAYDDIKSLIDQCSKMRHQIIMESENAKQQPENK